jgi:hypothetical protein
MLLPLPTQPSGTSISTSKLSPGWTVLVARDSRCGCTCWIPFPPDVDDGYVKSPYRQVDNVGSGVLRCIAMVADNSTELATPEAGASGHEATEFDMENVERSVLPHFLLY